MGLGASNDSHLIGTDDGEVARESPSMRGLCVLTHMEKSQCIPNRSIK